MFHPTPKDPNAALCHSPYQKKVCGISVAWNQQSGHYAPKRENKPHRVVMKLLKILLIASVFTTKLLASSPDNESTGQQAALNLKKNLKGALTSALAEGDVARAIEICSTKAMILTAQAGDVNPAIVSISRRTDRWRNPANQADEGDLTAMEAFRKDANLTEYLQPESDNIVRYYQPLRIMPMCLQCHGEPEAFPPEVSRILAERYAGDQATGYADGDLRGVIRVRLNRTSKVQL